MIVTRVLFYSSMAYIAFMMGSKKISVDSEFQPYYNEYMTIVKENCNSSQYVTPRQLEIKFADLEYPEIGVCKFNYFGRHIIEIDKKFWNRSNNDNRFNLMFHEQTHCVFHVGHTPDPNNFMYAALNYLTISQVNEQLKQFLKEHCPR